MIKVCQYQKVPCHCFANIIAFAKYLDDAFWDGHLQGRACQPDKHRLMNTVSYRLFRIKTAGSCEKKIICSCMESWHFLSCELAIPPLFKCTGFACFFLHLETSVQAVFSDCSLCQANGEQAEGGIELRTCTH